MQEAALQRLIVDEFSSPATQELYVRSAEDGLWESERAVLSRFFRPGSSVLDLGCGTGRTTLAMAKMGFTVVGIDLTPSMVESAGRIAAARESDVSYDVGDATDLSFPNESFDAALFSFNGLMQVPSSEKRARAFAEVFRVLRKGGLFIFTAMPRDLTRFDWQKQLVKHFLLRPLGLKRPEREWGDRVFQRVESGGLQFMHYASPREVKRAVRRAGFALRLAAPSASFGSTAGRSPTVFYVCEKPRLTEAAARFARAPRR